jgi:lipopolysaccharide export system permease protein
MQKPFLYSANGEVPLVQLAATGIQLRHQNGDSYLVFAAGLSYSGVPGRADYRITEFSSYGVRVREKELSAVSSRIGALPSSALLLLAGPEYTAEWHWRLAVPIACFVLALMALPLSHTAPRKGRFAKLGVGMLIYLVYSNFIGLGKAWLERDLLPAWIGLWWVHLIFFMSVVLLVLQREQAGLFSRRANDGKAA